jgi:ATP-dependent Lon protease
LKIAKQYIIPKALESNGLPLELIKFNDEAIAFIIRSNKKNQNEFFKNKKIFKQKFIPKIGVFIRVE